MGKEVSVVKYILVMIMALMLSACGETARIEKELESAEQQAEMSLQNLERDLSNGSVRNAIVLAQYADFIAKQRPELAELARELAKDSSVEGPTFTDLQNRLKDAKERMDPKGNWQDTLEELNMINEAAQRSMYNDALSDPVNVLADLSNGQLARVNSVSREASIKANGAQDYGASGRLVGNPHYGTWRTDRNGMSFWEWYGMYSMFSNIFTRPIYYSNWAYHRDYSYYHDYGRRHYTSSRDMLKQDQVETRARKTFGSKGKSFQSPYAKTRTGSSSLSRASQTASLSKYKSQFSKSSSSGGSKSSYSKGGSSQYGSSFRSGSSRSSSGSFGGK